MNTQISQNDAEGRITAIQQKLNYLCCEHDSLMPVLQIYDSASHVHRWENTLKNLNRKINEYENSFREGGKEKILSLGDHDKSSQSCKKMQNIRKDFQRLKYGLKELRENVPQNNINFERQMLKRYVTEELDEIHRYTQISLASLSNELEISHKLQREQEIPPQKLNKVLKGLFTNLDSQYSTLNEEIQVIRSNIPELDIEKFHEFTFERLGCDLVEINESVQNIFGQIEETQYIDSEQEQKIEQLKERFRLVSWQIKGMKKKYLIELGRRYLEEQNKYGVHCLQKKLVSEVKELEESYEIIVNKIGYLDNEITKR